MRLQRPRVTRQTTTEVDPQVEIAPRREGSVAPIVILLLLTTLLIAGIAFAASKGGIGQLFSHDAKMKSVLTQCNANPKVIRDGYKYSFKEGQVEDISCVMTKYDFTPREIETTLSDNAYSTVNRGPIQVRHSGQKNDVIIVDTKHPDYKDGE